ncbi:hypothetical protein [[Limnothrix rosea] IAM M-220]|uniref:hypothetical protein n=1 Tax=[Limnothrix rosea] IAM M-220 TaxID=454133 RepID=UPI0015C5409B|nr:hypothetical protein [[Limnothrix rosea] IAM M-220]
MLWLPCNLHHDLDPFAVLASLLRGSVEVLGYVNGAISLICLGSGLWSFFRK